MAVTETPDPTEIAQATAAASSDATPPPYAEPECAAGGTCGGEGVVLALDIDRPDLDAAFGLNDPLSLPASDEVVPIIFDGALISEEGVLDCFARHYPGRAGVLLGMMTNGYRIQFIDALAAIQPLSDQIATDTGIADRETERMRGMSPRGTAPDGMPYEITSQQQAIDYALAVERRNNASDRMYDVNRDLGMLGEWRIEGSRIIISDIIDPAHASGWSAFTDSTYGVDSDWEWLPTNRQGASRLNALIGHFMATKGMVIHGENGQVVDRGEESPRARTKRWLVGTGLVIAGAAEVVGGVFAISQTKVAGYALTTTGIDAYTQGLQTLFTPVTEAGRAGLVGDAFYAAGDAIGGSDLGMKFETLWSMGSVAVAIGAGAVVSLRYADRVATSVGRAQVGDVRPLVGELDTARLATVEIKSMKLAEDITGDLTSLASARGWILNILGREIWIPSLDSMIRVLLRLRQWDAQRFISELDNADELRAGIRASTADEANELLRLVARNCGVDEAELVSAGIHVMHVAKPASFVTGPAGQTAIKIDPEFWGHNFYRQYMFLVHELNHARLFNRIKITLGSGARAHEENVRLIADKLAFWREELLVQRATEWHMRRVFREHSSIESVADFADAMEWSGQYIENAKRKIGEIMGRGKL